MFGAWTVTSISPELLKPLMLFMLAAIAVYTIFKKKTGVASQPLRNYPLYNWLGLFFCSLRLDFMMGSSALALAPFFYFCFSHDWHRFFLKAAGNAKLLNLGSNMAALLMFMYLDHVHYVYGLVMGTAQIFGSIVGSQVAIKRGSGFVRQLFIIVSITLLIKNSYDYFVN